MNLLESHKPCELLAPSGRYAVYLGGFHAAEVSRFYRVFRTDTGKTVRSGESRGDPFKLMRAMVAAGYRKVTLDDRIKRYG